MPWKRRNVLEVTVDVRDICATLRPAGTSAETGVLAPASGTQHLPVVRARSSWSSQSSCLRRSPAARGRTDLQEAGLPVLITIAVGARCGAVAGSSRFVPCLCLTLAHWQKENRSTALALNDASVIVLGVATYAACLPSSARTVHVCESMSVFSSRLRTGRVSSTLLTLSVV